MWLRRLSNEGAGRTLAAYYKSSMLLIHNLAIMIPQVPLIHAEKYEIALVYNLKSYQLYVIASLC
jgi:hypothetical protein